jgi:hypothetical protein
MTTKRVEASDPTTAVRRRWDRIGSMRAGKSQPNRSADDGLLVVWTPICGATLTTPAC